MYNHAISASISESKLISASCLKETNIDHSYLRNRFVLEFYFSTTVFLNFLLEFSPLISSPKFTNHVLHRAHNISHG